MASTSKNSTSPAPPTGDGATTPSPSPSSMVVGVPREEIDLIFHHDAIRESTSATQTLICAYIFFMLIDLSLGSANDSFNALLCRLGIICLLGIQYVVSDVEIQGMYLYYFINDILAISQSNHGQLGMRLTPAQLQTFLIVVWLLHITLLNVSFTVSTAAPYWSPYSIVVLCLVMAVAGVKSGLQLTSVAILFGYTITLFTVFSFWSDVSNVKESLTRFWYVAFGLIGMVAVVLCVGVYRMSSDRAKRRTYSDRHLVLRQYTRAAIVLDSLLPGVIRQRVEGGARNVDNFQELQNNAPPEEIVSLMSAMFSKLDEGECMKIENVREMYVAVSGVPTANPRHGEVMALLGLDMIAAVSKMKTANGNATIRVKVGIHSGGVTGGVIGLASPRFCLFGDTMNVTARLTAKEALVKTIGTQVYRAVEADGVKTFKGVGDVPTYVLSNDFASFSNVRESSMALRPRIKSAPNKSAVDVSVNHSLTKYTQKFRNKQSEESFMKAYTYSMLKPSLYFTLAQLLLNTACAIWLAGPLNQHLVFGLLALVTAIWSACVYWLHSRETMTLQVQNMNTAWLCLVMAIRSAFIWFRLVADSPHQYFEADILTTAAIISSPCLFYGVDILHLIIVYSTTFVSELIVFAIYEISYSMLHQFLVRQVLLCCVAGLTALLGRSIEYERREKIYLEKEITKAKDSILNILLMLVVDRVLDGQPAADSLNDVTVLQLDIVGFTQTCRSLTPKQASGMLNQVYSSFDKLLKKHDVWKMYTIGDAYVAMAGLPDTATNHAEAICGFALDIMESLRLVNEVNAVRKLPSVNIRVGIYTGHCVVGVVGTTRPAFLGWGEAIMGADRMEQTGQVGRIHIGFNTYRSGLVRKVFDIKGLDDNKDQAQSDPFVSTLYLVGRKGRGNCPQILLLEAVAKPKFKMSSSVQGLSFGVVGRLLVLRKKQQTVLAHRMVSSRDLFASIREGTPGPGPGAGGAKGEPKEAESSSSAPSMSKNKDDEDDEIDFTEI